MLGNSDDVERTGIVLSSRVAEKYVEEIVHKRSRTPYFCRERSRVAFSSARHILWQKEVLAFHKTQREIVDELARVRDQSLDTRMDFHTYIPDFFLSNEFFGQNYISSKRKKIDFSNIKYIRYIFDIFLVYKITLKKIFCLFLV